jgi:hypothetical protein
MSENYAVFLTFFLLPAKKRVMRLFYGNSFRTRPFIVLFWQHEEAEVKARQCLRLIAAKSQLTISEMMEQELLHDILHQATNNRG